MLEKYRTNAIVWVGLGILLPFLSFALEQHSLQSMVGLFSLVAFIYGLSCYARGKGYPGAWCLLGFLGLIGLIILICFRDMYKDGKEFEG